MEFFKSGKYLFWIASLAIMWGGAVIFHENGFGDGGEDPAIGSAILSAGILVWIRATAREKRNEKQNGTL